MHKQEKVLLEALSCMWEQYCPPPCGHAFMSTGEEVEQILLEYGVLMPDGHVDFNKVESFAVTTETEPA